MIEDRAHSGAFREIAEELLTAGVAFRFQARGRSMLPIIYDGDILHVRAINPQDVRTGEIVLFKDNKGFKAHRVLRKEKDLFVTRGDSGVEPGCIIRGEQIMGKIAAKECAYTGRVVALEGLVPRMNYLACALKRIIGNRIRRSGFAASHSGFLSLLFVAALLAPVSARAQQTVGGVALDNSNTQSFEVSGNGNTCLAVLLNWSCSFIHTTNVAATNSLLLVGISMNNQGNGNDSQVTTVTYNGISLGSAAVNYNGANTNLRVQIYYFKNPAIGAHTITATVHKTGGGNNPIGVVIGAMTLYNVDTTFGSLKVALGTGTSASASAAFAAGNAPGTNDGVIDVLSVIHGTAVTPNTNTTAPLVFENQQWDVDSGTTGQDVKGHSSSAGGIGAALTMQETLGASTAWIIGAVAVPASHPTAVRTEKFSATQSSNGILLSWHTGGEMHNLGFNLYREVGGQKVKVNPSLVAGSVLLMRQSLEQHGAKTYGWMDKSSAQGGLYWLEDVDLNGTRTIHGPVQVESSAAAMPLTTRAMMLQDLSRTNSMQASSMDPAPGSAHVREAIARTEISSATREVGFRLASQPAVKIYVDHEGWYRVTQAQLVTAGLNPNAEARSLHLFVEGVEQPIRITGAADHFGPNAAIEFYGTAIDTPYSGQRVYWLATSDQPGRRIRTESASGSAGPQAQSFMQTLELKPRTTYFAALLQENTDNFFGPLISSEPADQTFNISNLAAGGGSLEVALQGVTPGQQHDVTATLNGATLGNVIFAGQQEGKAKFPIPTGVLINGPNTLTLTAQQGDNDFSLVNRVNVSFPHTFTPESDSLKFTAAAGQSIAISGFMHPPARLIDITNSVRPIQLRFKITAQSGTYTLTASIPWSSGETASVGTHTVLALADAQLAAPIGIAPHHPSNLHSPQPGADEVMLAAPQFMDQVRPLATLRNTDEKSVAVVNVDDVYDEFNFGERSPFAIRRLLRTATAAWKTPPHYLLLAGNASVDPRNYLGFGFLDFVPTKIVITSALKTASDDWFSDFENTGFAKIATGRLPARTPADMQTMVSKILGYAGSPADSWTNQSMMVADVDDSSASFSQAALATQKMIPSFMNVSDVFASTLGAGPAQQNLLAGINAGQLLVNYNGHGSVEIWGSGLFNDSLATSLNNGNKLPMFVAMNCLNGFFHDVFTESLATALMLAPNGGAVSVWASSGLTEPEPQFQMDQALMQGLFSQSSTVGDAVLFAKSGIADPDVRKTFILFGDPMMRLKSPSVSVQPRPFQFDKHLNFERARELQ
jgi:hypothetical protein